MRALWFVSGVVGISTAAFADLTLQFDTAVNQVSGSPILNAIQVVAGDGGVVATQVQYEQSESIFNSVVYGSAAMVGSPTIIATTGDSVFEIGGGEGSGAAFNGFANLSLSQSGGDRVSFLGDPGSQNLGLGAYQYRVSTGDKYRIVSNDDAVVNGGTFSFEGAHTVDTAGLQVNAAGNIVVNGHGTDTSNTRVVVTGSQSIPAAAIAGNTSTPTDNQRLTNFTDGSDFVAGYSKTAITENDASVFLATRTNTISAASVRAIVEATTLGSSTVRVADGTSVAGVQGINEVGATITPHELFAASNDGQLFKARINRPSGDNYGIFYHDNPSNSYTLVNQFSQPNDGFDFTGGVMTANGTAAILSAEGSQQGVRYFDPVNGSHLIATVGQSVGGFQITQITTNLTSEPMVNDNGWVIFDAILTGGINAILGWEPGMLNTGPVIITRDGGTIDLDGTVYDVLSILPVFNESLVYDGGVLKDGLSDDNHLAFSVFYDSDLGGGVVSTLAVVVSTLPDAGEFPAVPEPASISLIGLGVFGLLSARRRRPVRVI